MNGCGLLAPAGCEKVVECSESKYRALRGLTIALRCDNKLNVGVNQFPILMTKPRRAVDDFCCTTI